MCIEIWKTVQGIRNLSNDWISESKFHWQSLEPSTWNPESTAWNPESKTVLDSLTWGEKSMLVDICSYLEDSVIVGNNINYLKTLRSWLSPVARSVNSAWKLCWRASVDGWAARTFHSRCDGKGPTVTIIRVGKYIFGGYTSISWGRLTLQKEIILLRTATSFVLRLKISSRSLQLFNPLKLAIPKIIIVMVCKTEISGSKLSIKFLYYNSLHFWNKAIDPATSASLIIEDCKTRVKGCSNKTYRLYSKTVCNWRLLVSEFTIYY